jgi:hypothetical protein
MGKIVNIYIQIFLLFTKIKTITIFKTKNMSIINNREIAQAEKEILAEKYKTALKKAQFVEEVKSGLGEEIKKKPKPIIKKPTLGQKIMTSIKKIFTKF